MGFDLVQLQLIRSSIGVPFFKHKRCKYLMLFCQYLQRHELFFFINYSWCSSRLGLYRACKVNLRACALVQETVSAPASIHLAVMITQPPVTLWAHFPWPSHSLEQGFGKVSLLNKKRAHCSCLNYKCSTDFIQCQARSLRFLNRLRAIKGLGIFLFKNNSPLVTSVFA